MCARGFVTFYSVKFFKITYKLTVLLSHFHWLIKIKLYLHAGISIR